METSPVISDYGIVYVLGQSGGNCRLYAIDIGIAGPADSPWRSADKMHVTVPYSVNSQQSTNHETTVFFIHAPSWRCFFPAPATTIRPPATRRHRPGSTFRSPAKEGSGDGLWTQQEIHFTNTSQITGSSAAAFESDFGFQGVGSTSTEENPTVVFTSAGEKTVTLTVTAADGTKVSGSQKITLQRTNGLPEASFTHDPEGSEHRDEVTFTDTSVDSDGEIVSWAWDFGDGNRSEHQSPVHPMLHRAATP